MANCPSAQPTAVTRVEDVPGGVALLVTATGEEPTRAIRALAAFHQRIAAVEGKRFEHTGMHGGPGDRGWCPIVHTGTHVSFMRIPGGARIEVRVLPGHDVEALRREVNARIAKLPKAIANQ